MEIGTCSNNPAARQYVVHGHITVDGKKVDRPSYQTSLNQVISIRPKSLERKGKSAEINFMKANLDLVASRVRPKYLELDIAKREGTVVGVPEGGDLPFNVDTQNHQILPRKSYNSFNIYFALQIFYECKNQRRPTEKELEEVKRSHMLQHTFLFIPINIISINKVLTDFWLFG